MLIRLDRSPLLLLYLCAFVESYVGGLFVFTLPMLTPSSLASAYLGIIGFSLLGHPLGSIAISWLGDKLGRVFALKASLTLMAISVLLVFTLSPHTPHILRTLFIASFVFQVSSGGQLAGSAIFSLEQKPRALWGRTSGRFCAASVIAILASSATAAWLPHSFWKAPFYLSAALIGFCLAGFSFLPPPRGFADQEQPEPTERVAPRALMIGFLISSFYGMTYYLTFAFLNYAPVHFAKLPQQALSVMTSRSLVIYLFALWAAGSLTTRHGIQTVMKGGALSFGVLSPLAFWLCGYGTLEACAFGQGILAICAGFFVGPSYAFMGTLFPQSIRYRSVAIPFSLAMASVGGATPSLCLFIIDKMGGPIMGGLLLFFLSLLTVWSFSYAPKDEEAPLEKKDISTL